MSHRPSSPRRRIALSLAGILAFGAIAAGSYLGLRALTADPAPAARAGDTSPEDPSGASDPSPESEPSPTSESTSSPEDDGGQPLQGSALDLIGSVVSQRNLQGLLVQINQIDVCTAPQLTVFLTLTDEQQRTFTDARSSDFEITVDGETISEFGFSTARAENLPLSTVLLIDHSGSMKGSALERTRLAAVDYVKRAAPQDRVGIIQFDDRIDLLSKVTSNKRRVVRLIRGIRERGDTALYDSVSAGVKAAPECGRKAIVLMTDGRDTASTTTNLKDALQAANRANIPVFVVGLRTEQFSPKILTGIAEGSGAQYFQTTSPAGIARLYRRIDAQLGGQYVLRFTLDIPRTGQERRLRINSTVENSPTFSTRSFIY